MEFPLLYLAQRSRLGRSRNAQLLVTRNRLRRGAGCVLAERCCIREFVHRDG